MGVDVAIGGATEIEAMSVAKLFADWDRTFSRFRAGSELNRVNATRADTVLVSPLFAGSLRAALDAASLTSGLVDPTLGRAIEAAGYDRDFALVGNHASPLGSTAPGSWRSVRLSGRALTRPPGTLLDLNGVVKALAVDAALALLAGEGFVAAGGDVAARGGTIVGLPGGGSVRLVRGGVATSGTSRRRWLRDDGLQHHLIDPRTGRPARTRWTEVTVLAGSCLSADVAAKAAFLHDDDGPDWLAARGLQGRFADECGVRHDTLLGAAA
jgi:thiamine biosynthesis lipoprotein